MIRYFDVLNMQVPDKRFLTSPVLNIKINSLDDIKPDLSKKRKSLDKDKKEKHKSAVVLFAIFYNRMKLFSNLNVRTHLNIKRIGFWFHFEEVKFDLFVMRKSIVIDSYFREFHLI